MAPMPDEVLKAKLQAVMFESAAAMRYMTPEDKDRLVRNAQLLDYLRIAPEEDPDLNARLTEALGHPVGAAPSADVYKRQHPPFSSSSPICGRSFLRIAGR